MMIKLFCLIFGHKLIVTQRFDEHSRRCYCRRCKRMFIQNPGANPGSRDMVPWDRDFHEVYARYWKVLYTKQELSLGKKK